MRIALFNHMEKMKTFYSKKGFPKKGPIFLELVFKDSPIFIMGYNVIFCTEENQIYVSAATAWFPVLHVMW